MKLSEDAVRQQAEGALRACLATIPFLRMRRVRNGGSRKAKGPDLIEEVETPSGKQTLVVEAKTSGQPKTARGAIEQLNRYRSAHPKAYGIFAAPYISARTARICGEQDVGYLDLSGNCRLCFAGVFVEREGKPNQFAEKRELRSLYSRKATRVLRALLDNCGRTLTLTSVADEARVSLGLVWKVKELLLDREWISSEPSGVSLTKPEALLLEWSENYSFRKNEARDYYSLEATASIEADLGGVCSDTKTRYALAAFSAAARLAQAVRYQRTFAYVDGSTEDVAKRLRLKKVASGPNVTLLKPYDAGVFSGAREVGDVWITSPVQTYLDLASFKGRGEEAARVVLEEVIKPQWRRNATTTARP